MPRLVWLEGVGDGDLLRMTVANSVGILASGVGHADELEGFGSGSDRCLSSGEIWIELTEEPHVWNVSVISATNLGDIRLSSFEFACAVQRVQLERANFIGIPERNLTASEARFEEELRARRGIIPPRVATLDS